MTPEEYKAIRATRRHSAAKAAGFKSWADYENSFCYARWAERMWTFAIITIIALGLASFFIL